MPDAGMLDERDGAVDLRDDRGRAPHLDLVGAHDRIVDLEALGDRPALDLDGHAAHLDAIDLDAHLLGRDRQDLDPVASGSVTSTGSCCGSGARSMS